MTAVRGAEVSPAPLRVRSGPSSRTRSGRTPYATPRQTCAGTLAGRPTCPKNYRATAVAPCYVVTGENRAGSRLADRGRDVRAIRARAIRAPEIRGNGSRLGHTDVRHPN